MLRKSAQRSAGAAAATLAAVVGVAAATTGGGVDPFSSAQVGRGEGGRTLLPDNQFVTPVGERTEITNGRLISSALSPDGTKLAALTSNALLPRGLTIFDLKAGTVLQQFGPAGSSTTGQFGDGRIAADGPLYSPDGRTLWVAQATDVLRLAVKDDGTVDTTPVATIPFKATHGGAFDVGQPISKPNGEALPSGMALSADGRQLYVALNGNNTLAILDTATNSVLTQIPVGIAPRQVVVQGRFAWVSDEGGRRPRRRDFTNWSDYSRIVADRRTGAATSGTVSLVDLRRRREVRQITVGLGPAAMLLDHRQLFVANANNDSVSVIDTRRRRVTRTILVQPLPGAPVGSHVNAILRPDSRHLLLSLGRDNAIAEYSYTGRRGPVRLLGLIPTDWYPVAIQRSAALGGRLVITSGKGRGSRGVTGTSSVGDQAPVTPHITHFETGSVATLPLPGAAELRGLTARVRTNNNWTAYGAINSGAGDTVPSVIPPRRGLPSPIKHVFLIVKENRTYDQVLGDLGAGNGDPSLAEFGAAVTPNMHALARRFGTLDNFFDEGTLSADGHNWVVQADANDYVESQFGSFSRSYPASGSDGLAYQRSGFLWDRALRAHLSVRNYGEYLNWITTPDAGAPTWAAWYKDAQILEGKASGPLPIPVEKYRSYTDVPALNAVTNPAFPLFDLDIPDQYRVDIWHRDFQAAVASGNLPALTLMTIMSDHTATGGSSPNPVSEVADNDLALGRIVSEISHSRYWPSSAIFVVEDDSQAGVDHVDGHRAPIFVISPYSKAGVDSTYYTQLNMTRTIEQILGLSPLTQGDANAIPMYEAFTAKPDPTPFEAQANIVPLTLGAAGASPGLAADRQASAVARRWRWLIVPPASMRRVVAAWRAWGRDKHFGGSRPRPDVANPDLLNHYDWYAAHGWRTPYPGETEISTPTQLRRAATGG